MSRSQFLGVILSPVLLLFRRKEDRPPEYALKFARASWADYIKENQPRGIFEKICFIKKLHPGIQISTRRCEKYNHVKGICTDGYVFNASSSIEFPEEQAWDLFVRLIKEPKFTA